ncbi:MAG: site-specific integrase [Candidatus Azobacteroides sp.]|nr:site-specific integrase [Candidatus Azobacteroides sp.]
MDKVNNPVKAKTVKDVFELYMKQLRTANRIRYSDMFKTTYNSLVRFNGHLDIHFSEIDTAWLKRYEAFMRSENLAMNTLGTRFVRLRTIFNFAIEEKIVKPEYYPFGKYKVSKLKQKTAKRSILKSEVLKVLNYKGKTDYECLSIDLFTFSYLTAGINFTDISNLTQSNVIDNRLSYIRQKTKKVITIPVQPKAFELIEKYKESGNP